VIEPATGYVVSLKRIERERDDVTDQHASVIAKPATDQPGEAGVWKRGAFRAG
jgi:hypothetical protein